MKKTLINFANFLRSITSSGEQIFVEIKKPEESVVVPVEVRHTGFVKKIEGRYVYHTRSGKKLRVDCVGKKEETPYFRLRRHKYGAAWPAKLAA